LHRGEEGRFRSGVSEDPPHEGGLSKDIILFSNADWDHKVRTNSQHMAECFAQRGLRVLYIESLGLRRPSAGARDLKRIGKRLVRGLRGVRRVSGNIWVHSPLVLPFHGSLAVQRFNKWLIQTSMSLITRGLGFKRPIVWTYNPLVQALWEGLGASLLVYHCVDDLAAVPGIPGSAVRQAEESLVPKADAVFTTSRELYNRLSKLSPKNTHCLPNVADFAHFASADAAGPVPDDLQTVPRPRIGFIGTLSTYKLDVDLIAGVADRNPHWHWVFVGPLGTVDSLALTKRLGRGNVHLLGYREYASLPDYLRGFDAAVIPCALNQYTRSMFPMKFFEYLAAGKPVVTTPLDAITEYADACFVAGTIDEFSAALERVFAGIVPDKERGVRMARQHTWDTRLDEMLRVMEQSMAAKAGSALATSTDAR
jgi:glycosyltransferase involved in cell wall biosynthesis